MAKDNLGHKKEKSKKKINSYHFGNSNGYMSNKTHILTFHNDLYLYY